MVYQGLIIDSESLVLKHGLSEVIDRYQEKKEMKNKDVKSVDSGYDTQDSIAGDLEDEGCDYDCNSDDKDSDDDCRAILNKNFEEERDDCYYDSDNSVNAYSNN